MIQPNKFRFYCSTPLALGGRSDPVAKTPPLVPLAAWLTELTKATVTDA